MTHARNALQVADSATRSVASSWSVTSRKSSYGKWSSDAGARVCTAKWPSNGDGPITSAFVRKVCNDIYVFFSFRFAVRHLCLQRIVYRVAVASPSHLHARALVA